MNRRDTRLFFGTVAERIVEEVVFLFQIGLRLLLGKHDIPGGVLDFGHIADEAVSAGRAGLILRLACSGTARAVLLLGNQRNDEHDQKHDQKCGTEPEEQADTVRCGTEAADGTDVFKSL